MARGTRRVSDSLEGLPRLKPSFSDQEVEVALTADASTLVQHKLPGVEAVLEIRGERPQTLSIVGVEGEVQVQSNDLDAVSAALDVGISIAASARTRQTIG